MLKSGNCTIRTCEGVMYITFPIFEKAGGVKHCFSTKIGGVSQGRYSQMNLSYTNGDDLKAVRENFKRICKCIDVRPDSVVVTRQTHTVNIRDVYTKDDILPPDTDGLITDKSGITLCSSFADCVPILFYCKNRHVIATAHSGWRGTVNEIGRLMVEKMAADYNCNPDDVLCVIGPAICKNCYEVDDTVMDKIKLLPYVTTDAYYKKTNGRYQLDLKEVCRQTLIEAGIAYDHILVSDICTCCNSEFLHSHRATGGKRGNLCALIALDDSSKNIL